MSKRPSQDTRQLRAIGHHLKPLVMLGGKGLSEPLLSEVNRALDDHELIKVRVSVEDRDQRDALVAELCEQTGAQLVQRIGHIALILRHAAKPKPKLSNLQRFKEA